MTNTKKRYCPNCKKETAQRFEGYYIDKKTCHKVGLWKCHRCTHTWQGPVID